MITDLIQRRIPKRKDRLNWVQIIYFAIFILVSLGVFIPSVRDFLGEYLALVFVLLLIFSGLGMTLYQIWAWHRSWREFAAQVGLAFETYKEKGSLVLRWPRVTGTYRGHTLQIKRFTRGAGRNKKIYTSIRIKLNVSLKWSLEISAKRWYSDVRRAIVPDDRQLQVLELRNESFDKKLVIKSDDESFVRNVLSSYTIQQEILEIRAQAPEFFLRTQGNELDYHERSNITDGDYMLAVVHTLLNFAGYIDRYGR